MASLVALLMIMVLRGYEEVLIQFECPFLYSNLKRALINIYNCADIVYHKQLLLLQQKHLNNYQFFAPIAEVLVEKSDSTYTVLNFQSYFSFCCQIFAGRNWVKNGEKILCINCTIVVHRSKFKSKRSIDNISCVNKSVKNQF